MVSFTGNKKLTQDERDRLDWSFDQLQLPVPDTDEYYSGSTAVTFINPAAFTLRLVKTGNVQLIRHPHITRPISSISLSTQWRLDIVQGGETTVTPLEARDINLSLRQKGLKVEDIGWDEARNYLRLAKKTEKFPQGFPTAFDPSILTVGHPRSSASSLLIKTKPYAWIYDTRPQNGQTPDIQDEEYGDLRDSFMAAWKKTKGGETKVIPDAMDNFWKACIKAAANGLTSKGWLNDTTPYYKRYRNQSFAYQQRLLRRSPAFS